MRAESADGGASPLAVVRTCCETSAIRGAATRILVAAWRDSAELRGEPGRIKQPLVAAQAT